VVELVLDPSAYLERARPAEIVVRRKTPRRRLTLEIGWPERMGLLLLSV